MYNIKGLVINYGEVGGASFTLQKDGGGGGSFTHAAGGHTSFEVVVIWELEVLAILMGGAKRFHSLRRGRKSFYPVLRAQKVSDPRFSHFVAPLSL